MIKSTELKKLREQTERLQEELEANYLIWHQKLKAYNANQEENASRMGSYPIKYMIPLAESLIEGYAAFRDYAKALEKELKIRK
ncbi:MAG: hypothetical protein HY222_06215 [Thaumarchaeota archaeon]|nr:hypothetical protein [Nitrososphaerota archaeon]MBI3641971.1 hypothetical protein [Nitrososphaerota archaeon]